VAKTIIERRRGGGRREVVMAMAKRREKGKEKEVATRGEGLKINRVGVFWGCGCNSSKKCHNGLIPTSVLVSIGSHGPITTYSIG